MLLQQIERFLRNTRTSQSRFGRDALGDPNFVPNLLDGRQPRPGTRRRVLDYIRQQEETAAQLDE